MFLFFHFRCRRHCLSVCIYGFNVGIECAQLIKIRINKNVRVQIEYEYDRASATKLQLNWLIFIFDMGDRVRSLFSSCSDSFGNECVCARVFLAADFLGINF